MKHNAINGNDFVLYFIGAKLNYMFSNTIFVVKQFNQDLFLENKNLNEIINTNLLFLPLWTNIMAS